MRFLKVGFTVTAAEVSTDNFTDIEPIRMLYPWCKVACLQPQFGE